MTAEVIEHMNTGSVVTTTPIRTFLKDHEILLISILCFALTWVVVGKVQDAIAKHDNANLQAITVKSVNDLAAANAAAADAAQKEADFKALAEKMQAQDAVYQQQLLALTATLASQQKVDATLTPTDLVARFNTLVPDAKASVTPTGVALPESGAVATVQQLESVPVLESQLSITNGQLTDANKLLVSEGASIAPLHTEIDRLNVIVNVDDPKKCAAEIKVEKDKAAKSKRHWFIIGYVAGFLSRQYIKTTTGF